MKKILILSILLIWTLLLTGYEYDEIREMFKKEGYSESEQEYYLGVYQYTEGFFKDALQSVKNAKSLGLSEEYNIDCEYLKSQIYYELNDMDNALKHIEIGMKYNPDFSYEGYRIFIRHASGENIEEEKNDLISRWKINNELDQYLLCDFLLKIEDYTTALSSIKDYEIMLKEKDITTTNLQYIFYAHAYYELGEYENSLSSTNKGKNIKMMDDSYLYYWDSIINYKLDNILGACDSFKKAREFQFDYHGRFMLLQFWSFSDENIKLLEEIEKSCPGR